MATEEDHFCSIEGAGLTDRLDNLRNTVDEAERDRRRREARERLLTLADEIEAGHYTAVEVGERSLAAIKEFFDAMGW